MSRLLWIGFICYFFSLPEQNCLCLCTNIEAATEGNTHMFSVSGQRAHRPISIPLLAQAGKRRKRRGVDQRRSRRGSDVAWPLFFGSVLIGHLLIISPVTGAH